MVSSLRRLTFRVGRRLYCHARGEVYNTAAANGERWLLEQLLHRPNTTTVLLDIGANRGDWSAYALTVGSALGQLSIFAFEPSRTTRAMLKSRLGAEQRVQIRPMALSAHEATES